MYKTPLATEEKGRPSKIRMELYSTQEHRAATGGTLLRVRVLCAVDRDLSADPGGPSAGGSGGRGGGGRCRRLSALARDHTIIFFKETSKQEAFSLCGFIHNSVVLVSQFQF